MSVTTWILLALAVVLVFWLVKNRKRSNTENESGPQPSPFHCVSITLGAGACQTAKTLKGARFLSAEAPLLPLVSCDASRCNCTFMHHADRRRGDRRNPYSAQSHGFTVHGGDERRHRRGRRQSDGMQVIPGL